MSMMIADVRPDWHALFPREHGLWQWVTAPLAVALLAAPHLSTLAASISVLAGFGAANALGKLLRGSERARLPLAPALAVAATAATAAIATSPNPAATAILLGGGGAGALGVIAARRGSLPRSQHLEAAVIAILAGLGAAIAACVGVAAIAESAAMGAWVVLGLWWINRQLAPVLPNRVPWPGGMFVAVAAVAVSVVIGIAVGQPLVGLVPLAYPLRMLAHRPPASAREAKRVGFTELAWTGAALVAVGIS